jgi:hypothetical protein
MAQSGSSLAANQHQRHIIPRVILSHVGRGINYLKENSDGQLADIRDEGRMTKDESFCPPSFVFRRDH